MNEQLCLRWVTIVDPTEYDIDKQMRHLAHLSNEGKAPFVEVDVGKVIGLYLAWKRLVDLQAQ